MTNTSLLIFSSVALVSGLACSPGSGSKAPGTGGSEAGTGGSAATGGAPAVTNPIPFGGSWTDGMANSVGIQGAFYILEDSVKDGVPVADALTHSDFDPVTAADTMAEPSKFDDTTTAPCISGTAAQVFDPANPNAHPFSAIWGGGIGMNLNEMGGVGSIPLPFNADAAGVGGFEFTMSGDVQGATVRFKATSAASGQVGEDFCAKITILPGQTIKVMLSELKHMCWGYEGTLTLDTTQLEAVQWQIVTDSTSPHTVTNFCVTSLGWLPPA